MPDFHQNYALIGIVKEYFRKADLGDPTIMDILTGDVEIRFPKFGTRSGKLAVGEFVRGLMRHVSRLQHYPDDYAYVVSGDIVVAEGWESGILRDGTVWPVPGKSDGGFCNVFRFRGNLISSVHIYVDPDFTGADVARFSVDA